ncbi:hypothetical protein [Clostridium ihumii]|uniref:hypothetical protein n=1 Tax=Clostridium ihumii TaxID=1470356 RepID=UPI003D33E3CF
MENKNVTSAIFLLDQKITPIEFLERVKTLALFFDKLTKEELKAIKHWIKNTTEDRLAEKAREVLDASKEEVKNMVANNAFIIKEMEEKAEKKGREEEKLELARNLLDILDDETIASKVGLNIDKVIKIRKETEAGQ